MGMKWVCFFYIPIISPSAPSTPFPLSFSFSFYIHWCLLFSFVGSKFPFAPFFVLLLLIFTVVHGGFSFSLVVRWNRGCRVWMARILLCI